MRKVGKFSSAASLVLNSTKKSWSGDDRKGLECAYRQKEKRDSCCFWGWSNRAQRNGIR